MKNMIGEVADILESTMFIVDGSEEVGGKFVVHASRTVQLPHGDTPFVVSVSLDYIFPDRTLEGRWSFGVYPTKEAAEDSSFSGAVRDITLSKGTLETNMWTPPNDIIKNIKEITLVDIGTAFNHIKF